jgi:hypothetical protein
MAKRWYAYANFPGNIKYRLPALPRRAMPVYVKFYNFHVNSSSYYLVAVTSKTAPVE